LPHLRNVLEIGGLPRGIRKDLPCGIRKMGIFHGMKDIPRGEGYSCLLTQTFCERGDNDVANDEGKTRGNEATDAHLQIGRQQREREDPLNSRDTDPISGCSLGNQAEGRY